MSLEKFVQGSKQKVTKALSPEEVAIVNTAISSNCILISCPNLFNRCPRILWNNKLPACYKNPDKFDRLEYQIIDRMPGAVAFLKSLATMTKTDFEVIQAQPLPTLREIAEEARRRQL